MKTATSRVLARRTAACLDAAQGGPVVITRRGKPVAVLIGVEGYDMEDVYYMTSLSFRREIESRRQQPTRPIDEVREKLLDRDE